MRSARAHVALLAALAACGGSKPPAHAEPSPAGSSLAAQPAPPASAPVPARPGRLSRGEVVATLSRGLGDFLTRVQIEPLLAGGKFRGWRIVQLRQGDLMWTGVDLAPGDVVTAVNGRPIERPEQALSAFQSLAVSSELRVTYERNGARRELVYPIDDDGVR
jgi:type II secretory pathway component PulC